MNKSDTASQLARHRAWVGFWSPLLSALGILAITVLLAQVPPQRRPERPAAAPQRLADSATALHQVSQPKAQVR